MKGFMPQTPHRRGPSRVSQTQTRRSSETVSRFLRRLSLMHRVSLESLLTEYVHAECQECDAWSESASPSLSSG